MLRKHKIPTCKPGKGSWESEIKRSIEDGSLMTKVHKNGRTAQLSLYWGTKKIITLNTNSDHVSDEDPWRRMFISWCPQACLIITHSTAKFILALRECSLASRTQMRALPGTREQACSCLIMWLNSPWRLAPLEFLRASNMFSASTVPSPSASNWAKAYKVKRCKKIKSVPNFEIFYFTALKTSNFCCCCCGRVQICHSKKQIQDK